MDYDQWINEYAWDEQKRKKRLYEWEQYGDILETGIGLVGSAARNELSFDKLQTGVGSIWKDVGEAQYGYPSYKPPGVSLPGSSGTAVAAGGGGLLLVVLAVIFGVWVLKKG